MTRSTRLTRAATIAAALGLSLGSFGILSAVAAQAAPSAQDQQQPPRPGPSLLLLSVAPSGGAVSTAVLTCNPAGGLHPSPVAACADISAARGNFAELPGDDDVDVCPDIYQPVVASTFGWWEGRMMWWNRTYGNMCELFAATGPVFPVPNEYGGGGGDDTPPPMPGPEPPSTTTTPPPTIG
jgi:Subtilisin inhibitor-like